MIQATIASMYDVTEKMDVSVFESKLSEIDLQQYSLTFDRLFVVFESIDELDEYEISIDESSIYLIIRIAHRLMEQAQDPFLLMAERFLGAILQLEDVNAEKLWRDCEERLLGVRAV